MARIIVFPIFSVQPATDVLDVAPEKFKLMLRELGIERTLNTLVAMLMKNTD